MQTIPLVELSIVFIPTVFLLVVMFRWQLKAWVVRKYSYDSSTSISRIFSNLHL